MLTAKQKADWVAALRSGEYKQGKGQLYNPNADTYCCLGVLSKVLNRLGNEDDFDSPVLGHTAPTCLRPSSLITMNDYDNKTFPEIADWIVENVPTQD